MATIRIPEEHWDDVWFALVEEGPVSRIAKDNVYLISDRQLQLLKRKNLPFELLTGPNGKRLEGGHA